MEPIQIIATIEVILALIIFVAIYVKDDKQKEKRCNIKVKGRIVERWTEERLKGNHFHGYRTFIAIEYEYNQEIYSTLIGISPYSMLRVHDTVEVMINPNNPKETYKVILPKELLERMESRPKKKEKIIDIIFKISICISAIAIIGFAIFSAVVLIFYS